MEVLETINKVFGFNLRTLRADRTQSEIAEAVGLSLRGYQRLEAGMIPRTPGILSLLAKALNADSETRLFLDPDLARHQLPSSASPTLGALQAVIAQQEARIQELEAKLRAIEAADAGIEEEERMQGKAKKKG